MSFHFSFAARCRSDAEALLEKQTAPLSVKQFVKDALRAVGPSDSPVLVEAHGHGYEGGNDHKVSTANIKVQPLEFSK